MDSDAEDGIRWDGVNWIASSSGAEVYVVSVFSVTVFTLYTGPNAVCGAVYIVRGIGEDRVRERRQTDGVFRVSVV